MNFLSVRILSLLVAAFYFTSNVSAKNCYPNCKAIETIDGPSTRSSFNSWFAQWTKWRHSELAAVDYNGSAYDSLAVWSSTAYTQTQLMANELFFYDYHNSSKYTVQRYLKEVTERFGGLDSLLVWTGYPNIGIDSRNQFGYARSAAGGVKALAAAFAEFRKLGVRVIVPYNPWDTGTERPTQDDAHEMAMLMRDTGADGLNGDTLSVVPREFWDAARALGVEPAIEPEEGGSAESLAWTKWGWGYWTPYSFIPSVDRWKWLEHRRLTFVCERWATNRTDGIQLSFFNGDSYVTWQNIWGSYNRVSDRDAAAVRRTSAVLRFFGRIVGGGAHFTSVAWIPHTPTMVDAAGDAGGLFASLFATNASVTWGPLPNETYNAHARHGATATAATAAASRAAAVHSAALGVYRVWLAVNRAASPTASGSKLIVDNFNANSSASSSTTNSVCYDAMSGQALTPLSVSPRGVATFAVSVPALDYAAFVCAPAARIAGDARFAAFMQQMSALTAKPLSSYSTAVEYLQQRMVVYTDANSSATAATAQAVSTVAVTGRAPRRRHLRARYTPPQVNVPRVSNYAFSANGIEVEGKSHGLGADFQYPWESSTQVYHSHNFASLGPFSIDKYPVTNRDWQDFVIATSYYPPKDANHYLQNWLNSTNYVPGTGENPVTFVALDDAQAYCKWRGARLPNEWEWQLAAQGTTGNKYPWGNHHDPSCIPTPVFTNNFKMQAVGGYPCGDSPYGASDMVGLVWQWTNYAEDNHTRAAILKGGTFYNPAPEPAGSKSWYFPNTIHVQEHGKYFIQSPSLDRAGTLGFRCLTDN